jgi:hypothetical protein
LCVHRIRSHWPTVRILVRGDSHYCGPEVLALLRRLDCRYILGLAINPKLDNLTAPWREQCANRTKPARPKVRRFHQLTYKARSWAMAVSVPSRLRPWWIARAGRIVWLGVLTHVGKDGKAHGGRDHLDGGAAA